VRTPNGVTFTFQSFSSYLCFFLLRVFHPPTTMRTLLIVVLTIGLCQADQSWWLSRDAPSATDDQVQMFRDKFAPTFPEDAFRLTNVPPSAFREQSIKRFHAMDDGNAYGRVGREAALELAKSALDAETVAKLYDVPVFTGPTGGCEEYANGGAIPESVMRPISFGRIHPVGSFNTSDASKEYFLLACPLLDRPLDNQVRVSRTWFKDISAYKNRVWVEVMLELSVPVPAPGAAPLYFNHTHIGFFLMDDNSVICGYKVLFQRLELRDPAPETQTDAVLNNRVANLCNNVVSACANATIPAEDQYASISDCISFNSAPARKARNGYQYVDQDSLKCREFHYGLIVQNIARGLPDHQAKHCTHSGPRGGGKCVTHSFASFFDEEVTCQPQA
jgi:hypothetical protein